MRFMAKMMMLVTLAVTPACSTPQGAIDAIKDGIAADQGHVTDAGLPPQAHEIAQDNMDFLYETLFYLDGTPMPPDTAARVQARHQAQAPTPQPQQGGGR